MKKVENEVVFEQLLITAPAKRSKKAAVPKERVVNPPQFQMIDLPGGACVDPAAINYIKVVEYGENGESVLNIGINGHTSTFQYPDPERARFVANSIKAKCGIARLGRAALVSETTEEMLELLRRAVLDDHGWKEKAKVLLTGEYAA